MLEGNERLTAEQVGLDADLALYSAKQAGGDRCVLFALGDVAAEAAPAP